MTIPTAQVLFPQPKRPLSYLPHHELPSLEPGRVEKLPVIAVSTKTVEVRVGSGEHRAPGTLRTPEHAAVPAHRQPHRAGAARHRVSPCGPLSPFPGRDPPMQLPSSSLSRSLVPAELLHVPRAARLPARSSCSPRTDAVSALRCLAQVYELVISLWRLRRWLHFPPAATSGAPIDLLTPSPVSALHRVLKPDPPLPAADAHCCLSLSSGPEQSPPTPCPAPEQLPSVPDPTLEGFPGRTSSCGCPASLTSTLTITCMPIQEAQEKLRAKLYRQVNTANMLLYQVRQRRQARDELQRRLQQLQHEEELEEKWQQKQVQVLRTPCWGGSTHKGL